MTTPVPSTDTARPAALAGAGAAGLALGITELIAGLTRNVPSAVSSVGSVVIDYTPPVVERTAISLFGTADKGALAIGTVIIALLIGAVVGVLSRSRRWLPPLAFGGFAVAGIAAAFTQPSYQPILTILAIAFAAAAGAGVLGWLLRTLAPAGDAAERAVAESPTDGLAASGSRRQFVAGVAGVGAAALTSGFLGRSLLISRSEQIRTSIELPQAAGTVPPPGPAASFAVPGLEPIVVPNDEFYRIDTALVVPRPDIDSWRLHIKGMVDNPVSLTYSDLVAMPLYEQYVTISCVSNEVGGGLVGNAKWTGVRLVELLDRAGVQEGATQVVGRSTDGWTAGFPTDLVFDGREPLVAIAMNGEMLPPRHGYPARLIVPGLYGYVSATKWLTEIELTTWEAFDGYWIPRGWSKEGPIKTQSRIDVPRAGAEVTAAPVVMAGVAWAPTRGVAKVEVRVDDGDWQVAELTEPLSNDAWVQWRHEMTLDPGRKYRLEVRATDGTGETQTSAVAPPPPSGATGYHTIEFTTA